VLGVLVRSVRIESTVPSGIGPSAVFTGTVIDITEPASMALNLSDETAAKNSFPGKLV
jgi:hypothetical protein